MMRPVVVSVGGSILAGFTERPRLLRDLAACLATVSRRRKLLVTTGGGPIAREYITAARTLGIPEPRLDEIGIAATRLNAILFARAIGRRADPDIPATVRRAVLLSRDSPIVVMGGTGPGWTTDAVAAQLAVAVKASHLVNATAVDGVYTADPKKVRGARRYETLTHAELVRLVGKGHTRAGPHVIFDPLAARTIARHRIPLYVVDGRDVRNLRAALEDRAFRGTRVG